MKIKIFTTGGTIDKDYSKKAGVYNFEISEPAIKIILNKIEPQFQYEITPLLKKDSLDMTEQDRQTIYNACKNESNDKIIITHGTDTMIKTAEKLSTFQDKTVILLGASKPAKFINSDAMFNIGIAIGAINILNNGCYIAMNGRIFDWDNVKKNTKNGIFEKIK